MEILSLENYVWVCHLGFVNTYNWAMSARWQSRVHYCVLHLQGQLEENAIKAILWSPSLKTKTPRCRPRFEGAEIIFPQTQQLKPVGKSFWPNPITPIGYEHQFICFLCQKYIIHLAASKDWQAQPLAVVQQLQFNWDEGDHDHRSGPCSKHCEVQMDLIFYTQHLEAIGDQAAA